MLTITCVLVPSKDYGAGDVARLEQGVKLHLTLPHRFICLTNASVPCESIPLEHNWPGWWSKIELFRLPPPVLYYDLDTILVGDQSDIARHAETARFTMLRDFRREDGLCSAMMSWSGRMTHVYETFAKEPERWMQHCGERGDQGYLEDQSLAPVHWQDALPGQIVSYKVHVRKPVRRRDQGDGTVPKDARVVCFHGSPKPADIGWKL